MRQTTASVSFFLHHRPEAQPAGNRAPLQLCNPALHLFVVLLVVVCTGTPTSGVAPGTVSTIGATGADPSGVLVDEATGNLLYVQGHSLQRMFPNGTSEVVAGSSTYGSVDGIGEAASFNKPWDISAKANDPQFVFVADRNNHCIRRVELNTRNVTTLAGACGDPGFVNGNWAVARFHTPYGVALHNSTNSIDAFLYIADYDNAVIRRFDFATAAVETFAGSGTIGSSSGMRTSTNAFRAPKGIAVDITGRWLYVVDDHCVRKVDTDVGGYVTTVAGSCDGANGFIDGVGSVARFDRPSGITINSNGSAVYVADGYNCAVRRVTIATNNVTTVSGRNCGVYADGPIATAKFGVVYNLGYYELTEATSASVIEFGLVVAENYHKVMRRVVLGAAAAETLSAATTLSFDGGSSTASASFSGIMSTTASLQCTPSATFSMGGATPSATGSKNHTESATRNVTSTAAVRTLSTSQTKSAQTTVSAVTRTHPTPTVSCSIGRNATGTLTPSSSPSRRSSSETDQMHSASAPRTISTTTSKSPALSNTDSISSWACGEFAAQNVSLQSTYLQTPLPSVRALAVSPGLGSPASTESLIAAELPRLALLAVRRSDLPHLVLSLSLWWSGSTHWDVASAASIYHAEQLVFNSTVDDTLPASTESQRRVITILLQPPSSSSMGWLQEGWGVYSPAEIVLELRLLCAAEGGNTSNGRTRTVRVVIPAPGAPREFAEKVETTAVAAQWTASIGGPGAGSAVGRVGAVRSMMLCGGGDNRGPSGGGLLGIRIDCRENSGTVAGSVSAARGAIFGNAGILAGSIFVVLIFVAAYTAAMRVTITAGCLRLAAPSVLLPIWIATLPSTSAGAAVLISSGAISQCPSDSGIVVLGLLICALPLCWMCFVALRLVPQLGLHIVQVAVPEVASLSSLRFVVQEALRRRGRWKPSVIEREGRSPSAQAKVLLDEYTLLWYAVLDAGVLVVSGTLSAVSGSGSHDLCISAGASIGVLYLLQLGLCALTRPFATLFAHVHALMTLVLSSASVGLQVGGMVASKNGRNDPVSLERQNQFSMASAVCDLCVIGISTVRVLLDGINCFKAVAGIVREVREKSSAEASGDSTREPPPIVGIQNEPPALPQMACDGGSDDDLLFWDDEGKAQQAPDGSTSIEGLLAVSQTVAGVEIGSQKWNSDLALALGSCQKLTRPSEVSSEFDGISTSGRDARFPPQSTTDGLSW